MLRNYATYVRFAIIIMTKYLLPVYLQYLV